MSRHNEQSTPFRTHDEPELITQFDKVRRTVPSIFNNHLFYCTLYFLTHHYTLFIILAFASSKGTPHMLVAYAPFALF